MLHLNTKRLEKGRQVMIHAIKQELDYKHSTLETKDWFKKLSHKSKIAVYNWLLHAKGMLKKWEGTPLDFAFTEMPHKRLR